MGRCIDAVAYGSVATDSVLHALQVAKCPAPICALCIMELPLDQAKERPVTAHNGPAIDATDAGTVSTLLFGNSCITTFAVYEMAVCFLPFTRQVGAGVACSHFYGCCCRRTAGHLLACWTTVVFVAAAGATCTPSICEKPVVRPVSYL